MLICLGTVRGGTCSYGSAWSAHVEGERGFRAIDLIYGVERKDVMRDRPPAERGDEIRMAVGAKELPFKSLLRRTPLKRIATYSAEVVGGWPTTYPEYFSMPNYWYVTLRPDLAFNCLHKDFSVQLGTLRMPFAPSERVTVTIDLINTARRRKELPLESYTYSC